MIDKNQKQMWIRYGQFLIITQNLRNFSHHSICPYFNLSNDLVILTV